MAFHGGHEQVNTATLCSKFFDMIIKPNVQKLRVRKWLDDIDGGTPTINTLDKIAKPIAHAITTRAMLRHDEEPLIVSGRDSTDWCLLTTARLIWSQDEVIRSLPWRDISGAQQPPEQTAKIIRGEMEKDQISDLELFDASNQRYLLRLNSGSAYYIVWSAILPSAAIQDNQIRFPCRSHRST
jgi:hypothetical protein